MLSKETVAEAINATLPLSVRMSADGRDICAVGLETEAEQRAWALMRRLLSAAVAEADAADSALQAALGRCRMHLPPARLEATMKSFGWVPEGA